MNEMTKVIGAKLLIVPRIFVENQQRFVPVPRRSFPHQQHLRIVAGQNVGRTLLVEDRMACLDGVDSGDV